MITQKQRCGWCVGDPLYEAYHDEEWGVPLYDDLKLFEFLILETFQNPKPVRLLDPLFSLRDQ